MEFADEDCIGICLTGYDVGVPSAKVAYGHPDCPVHSELTAAKQEIARMERAMRDSVARSVAEGLGADAGNEAVPC